MKSSSIYLGLMSGTSMDGISAALVDFSTTLPKLISSSTTAYPKELSAKLNQMIDPEWRGSLQYLLSVDNEAGKAFALASTELIQESGIKAESITAIGHHGQTLWHQPDTDTPSSLQIGDPNIIAEMTGITVVADWRRRDIAAGGQGAPLTPAFHLHCFGQDKTKAVLNLGGIANLTILSTQTGFDTGPANTLLDAWIRACHEKDFDQNGEWARTGKVNAALLDQLIQEPYFQQQPPKSTGREKFNLNWIKAAIANKPYNKEDIQATLTELTAKSVCISLEAVAPDVTEVVVCGGGLHNLFLMERLRRNATNLSFISSAEYGIDPDYMEAIAFAWLAQQTVAGKPGNLPDATGAVGKRVLGGIYSP